MRILYVADGRSPIALPWLEHFASAGHEVHLVSTRPCNPPVPLGSLRILPVLPSGGLSAGAAVGRSQSTLALVTTARHWLGPLAVRRVAPELAHIVHEIRPDLVHALRIPFEGMLAAAARPPAPILLSVWGNDFTLHAAATPSMRSATRRTLQRAQGLHADCQRDLRLAAQWGWPDARPAIVLPGNGGIRLDVFRPQEASHPDRRAPLPNGGGKHPLVIQPRGFRAYVRSDTFFRAIPLIRESIPGVEFAGVGMQGNPEVRRWSERLEKVDPFRALPPLDPPGMAAIFRAAWVSVSPSTHDGTPNTLLEAMACGCLPVAGDLESIREWIDDDQNGLLIDPGDPAALARAVVRALRDDELRRMAAVRNLHLIQARAERGECMRRAEGVYRQLVS